MNADQYRGITGRLDAILQKMPAVPQPIELVLTGWPYDREGPAPVSAKGSELAAAKSVTLRTFLGVLDGWIEGAQSNHESMNHRGENTGEECWRSFTPSDIRRMVNDAAREVGLTEFADLPEPLQEDKR